MTKRRLRPEELDLWKQVARSADPLKNRTPVAKPPPARQDGPEPSPPAPDPIPAFRIGAEARAHTQTYTHPSDTPSDRLRKDPLHMDARTFARMKRGKLSPDARIDLHGMTLDQAHPALIRFILSSQSHGHRMVLVITGKGSREDPYDPAPRRRGVLRVQVPHWLRMPPVGPAVLQIAPAHQKHGGEGAYYVYLRKRG